MHSTPQSKRRTRRPGWTAPRLSRALAAAGLLVATAPALAINGSGTWTPAGPVSNAETISGTFTTPQGDTGTYTLTRTAKSGYQPNSTFAATATGLLAQNPVCHSVAVPPVTVTCADGGDTFTYTLTLTGNQGPLVTEVVQGLPANSGGNSEPAQMTLIFGGTGYLAANPAVPLHPTNGLTATIGATPPGFNSMPQVRVAGARTWLDYVNDNASDYPAIGAGATVDSGGAVQLFGVANTASQYRFDLVNSTGVTLTYTGNMNGNNSVLTPSMGAAKGETFSEWIGFGVRSLPVAVNDVYPPMSSTAGGTTASVVANDAMAGAVPIISGGTANAKVSPGTSPVAGLTMGADGVITVAPDTAPGTYKYPYTLCAVPASTQPQPAYECVAATATVTVLAPPVPVNDTLGPLSTVLGGSAPSVLANDKLGDGTAPALGTNATLTWGSAPATGITLNDDGTVAVAPGTAVGTYTYTYTLCDTRSDPAQCKTATQTITVVAHPPPVPVNDAAGPYAPGTAATTPSVLANDQLGDGTAPVLGTNATLTWNSTATVGFTLNPDGTVSVEAGTPAGAHSFEYTLCDTRATPPLCTTATITVTIGAAPTAVPVGPWWLLVPPLMLAGGRALRRRGQRAG